MDLASMIVREDFFNHFLPTVEQYYKSVYDSPVSFAITKSIKDCNMVIKPKLSAVSSVSISKKAREFYYSEWNIRNSIIKNIIAKSYLFIATRTGRYFAQYRFKMSPEPEDIKHIIIAPNNRSIRFFNYESDVVGCMIKDGFSSKFFNNQIRFRETYKYDFILPMIDYGTNWFREPIMHGHPLARITDEKQYVSSKKDSIENMRLLAHDTVEYISSIIYIEGLFNKIMGLLERAVSQKKITTLQETKMILNYALQQAKTIKTFIPSVMSHGDLQTGNIWVDQNRKTWIYDWETADRRSAWYDASVLEYSLRRNNGWKELMSIEQPVAMNLCNPQMPQETNYTAMKAIVLMEDLCFYLEDLVELPEQWGVEIYDSFIWRLMEIETFKNLQKDIKRDKND